MRFLNNYKLHENYASADLKLPRRISKFKRPKWAKIKKKLRSAKRFEWVNNRKIWLTQTYINHFKIGVGKKYYVKKFFKFKQQTKKYLVSLFENNIKFNKKNKPKKRDSVVFSYRIKPLFKVDILLWYLHFFKSSAEVKSFINEKKVLINEKIVGSNYELKKGDIISFDLALDSDDNLDSDDDPDSYEKSLYLIKNNRYFKMLKRYKKSRQFFPFLEYDYYTNSIMILKNWNQLSQNEISLTVRFTKKFKYV